MAKPRCFVGSSSEALAVANAVHEALDREAEVTVWTHDVFEPSGNALDSLIDILHTVDFSVFVFAPDDVVRIRGREQTTPRDNVIFELGLSIGILGRRRSFLIAPRSEPDLRLPTDLLGLTQTLYDSTRSDGNMVAGVAVACSQIVRAIKRIGRLPARVAPTTEDPVGAVLNGVARLADIVTASYGPLGRDVSVTDDGRQHFTRSGARIATHTTGAELVSQQAISALSRSAREVASQVGDGSKLTILLASRMISEGIAGVEAGFSVEDVLHGMRNAVAKATAHILAEAVPIDASRLLAVAMSSGQDADIAASVVKGLKDAGPEGIVSIEVAVDRADVHSELEEGLAFDRGYLHADFASDSASQTVQFENCLVVICDGRISFYEELLPILQYVRGSRQPLLIVAENVDGTALDTLRVNHARGVVRCAAVRAPGLGQRQAALLQDIAAFTGARLIEHTIGRTLAHASPSDFGRVEVARISPDRTTLIGGGGTSGDIARRAESIRAEIASSIDGYERAKAQERLGRLRGRIVTLYVGGASGALRDRRRELTTSALLAAHAAIQSGAIVGGGVSLLRASRAVNPGSETVAGLRSGARAISRALEEPMRTLATSAKQDEAMAVSTAEKGARDDVGLNVRSRRFEDLRAAGVLDPASVVVRAIEAAFDTARAVLTTESWSADQSS